MKNLKSRMPGFKFLTVMAATLIVLLLIAFIGTVVIKPVSANTLQSQQQKPAVKQTIKFTPAQVVKDGEKPMQNPEKSPEFKGGMEAMQKYLATNIHYPPVAMKAGTQGKVYVQFVITKTGKIANAKVLRGIGMECDKEALRVVKSMPDWIPGQDKGKAVATIMQLPVMFQLSKNK